MSKVHPTLLLHTTCERFGCTRRASCVAASRKKIQCGKIVPSSKILENNALTLLHCPHSSPLAQPAIHSLMLNLRRFDLWAWATYTDKQKVAMLLESIPPKLDRQHEKAWVLLTFPTCTQLIYSLQSHSRLTQPSVFPVPSPLATRSSSPPSDDIHCQVCQSAFDEHQMLL